MKDSPWDMKLDWLSGELARLLQRSRHSNFQSGLCWVGQKQWAPVNLAICLDLSFEYIQPSHLLSEGWLWQGQSYLVGQLSQRQPPIMQFPLHLPQHSVLFVSFICGFPKFSNQIKTFLTIRNTTPRFFFQTIYTFFGSFFFHFIFFLGWQVLQP